MQTNTSTMERLQAAFRPTAARRHEIDGAIERLGNRHHAIIREVPGAVERMTWFECGKCGRVATTPWREGRQCARCGAGAVQQEWVRPDIAAAERRARLRQFHRTRRTKWWKRAEAWTTRRARTAGRPLGPHARASVAECASLEQQPARGGSPPERRPASTYAAAPPEV